MIFAPVINIIMPTTADFLILDSKIKFHAQLYSAGKVSINCTLIFFSRKISCSDELSMERSF